MFILTLWILAGLVAGVATSSFWEWSIHRYLMHRPLFNFRYAFNAHAVVHHQVFKGDHTYHLIHDKDKETIPMAWWNGPVIVAVGVTPFALLSWALGNWGFLVGGFIAYTGYYCVYEYIHWCMHLPKARRLERSWLFQRLNGHHILHHRYMHKNFNVVLPLADLCMGTLMRRSKLKFAQPQHPSVPDLQPAEAAAGQLVES